MIQYFTGRINDQIDGYDIPDINFMLREFSQGLTVIDEEWLRGCAAFPNMYIVLARDEDNCGENGFAQKHGKIIGMVLVNFLRKCAGAYGFVDDVVVREEYRGKQHSVAPKLLALLDDLGASFSVTHIDLTCGNKPVRMPAHRLYRRHGYITRNSTPYRKKYPK